ncbi:hypothetical protein DKX38_010072 [Salix brachista]|uniref:Leucine-rich repeat-containing N-terminal plant-type domain-containing protein n=1 Tax=Salix brachista TaxID=2182728 RepID=A0A5N5MEW7_9ROSI|nr:hypothetical protein DKX38_010072 [Salix brachista]
MPKLFNISRAWLWIAHFLLTPSPCRLLPWKPFSSDSLAPRERGIDMGSCKFSTFSFLCLIIILIVVSGEESPQLVKDRISLLSFGSGIVLDPEGALESWNSSSNHVCLWTGVKCDNASDHVTQLDLSGLSLHGRISPVLANLSSLLVLDLSRNFFEGHIPAELGYLFRLRQLGLSWNLLGGNIPEELGFLHQLEYLDLGSNKLAGDIPAPLFCNGSSSLEYMDLSNNSLTGKIPLKNECELSALRFLLLWSNRLVGRVPRALSKSINLKWLDLESNMLTGELPSEIIRKMPKLQFLYLSYNDFVSHDGNTNLEPFFASLVNSSDLQELELAGNNLRGEIPSIIGDLSVNFLQIHLDENLLYGSIPPHISNLVNLTLLNLSSNLLNGTIPLELCLMEKLERVYLSNNSLSGEIPAALANISHLGLLDLSKNKLTGPVPDSFANLSQLRRLLLHENQLSGTIPPSLGQGVNLEILDLSRNEISGIIPSEVAGLRSLKLYLNLSSNHLHGPLPLELSTMDMVLAIDLSSNNLSGSIPPQLGSCIALEHLNLSGNVLEGLLPATIGQLPYLKELDVSSNQLSGKIPQSLEASPTLKHLNFSFNKFSGNASNKGAFSSLTIDSFLGNEGLCGEIKGMPICQRKHAHHSFILPVLLSLFATTILCIFAYPLALSSRFRRKSVIFNRGDLEDVDTETKDLKHPRVSHRQLIEATGGFSSSSLIGADDSNPTDDSVSFSSTDGLLCGSVGYIAPGSSLHGWIKSHYPHKLKPIVDQTVLRFAPSSMPVHYSKIWSDVILELVELGLICTQNNPSTRPSMLDVANEMGSLKQYLSSPPNPADCRTYPEASA